MDLREISQRHHQHHPLAQLTEDELNLLQELTHLTRLLSEPIAQQVNTLGALADLEEGDRAYRAEISGIS